MWFSYKKLTTNDRQNQRKFLYRNLYEILKKSEIDLILPINPFLDNHHKLKKGLCHGYGEYWIKYIHSFVDVAPFDDWKNLLGEKDYFANEFILTEEIFELQKLQSIPKLGKKNFKNAIFCKNTVNLIDYISQIILLDTPLPNFLYIIDIAQLPVKMFNNIFNTCFMCFPNKIKHWHEFRIYIDDQNYLHLFDSNIGLFKTKKNNLKDINLTKILTDLFKVLQYDKSYVVVSINKVFLVRQSQIYSGRA
ncbi:MAG: hypothetical protein JWM09_913 [Francisellaceae bacterium]|nr:hypothetical protein [Francisellaceae bacterium]